MSQLPKSSVKQLRVVGHTTTEEWRAIPGCEGTYEVSSHGNVKSKDRYVTGGKGKQQHVPERILKQSADSDGYYVVSLRFNSSLQRTMKVHRLVLLAFRGASDLLCCHGDGNSKNNLLSNLRYGSSQDNADDRGRHGKKVGATGEANGIAKLTEKDVLKIRDHLSENLSNKKIADMFSVCAETIRKIALGITWKGV